MNARQHAPADSVAAEREVIGAQLVRRNDELSLLYEKVCHVPSSILLLRI